MNEESEELMKIEYEGGILVVHDTLSQFSGKKRPEDYEPEKVAFLRKHIKPGDVFVDVGACEGFFTFIASRLVGEEGHVVAVEPEPDNADRILQGTVANVSSNVLIRQYAISSYDGRGDLNVYQGTVGQHSLRTRAGRGSLLSARVEVLTLDTFANKLVFYNGVGPINGLKIDVEGLEQSVLLGGIQVFRNEALHYVAIDVHPSLGAIPNAVELFLTKNGFTLVDTGSQRNEVFAIRE